MSDFVGRLVGASYFWSLRVRGLLPSFIVATKKPPGPTARIGSLIVLLLRCIVAHVLFKPIHIGFEREKPKAHHLSCLLVVSV